ncbi:Shedu anti-phage system protein SduA domain-containing protein [Amycolatopsis pithecellobii]|uniref:DUF4263 domain-containing protein n=1 Tax=Amycolatopsis pithecellobii TaxID=664692 RepID=A0A6N7YUX0_9PSEU|nr:Shedu anti-phage system protein SduA domain-containing protein [Amycolatopsis pithecellobii]MTD56865.1 DUF4263 domain-containing protein [Amycolatopsis pithecellobii]
MENGDKIESFKAWANSQTTGSASLGNSGAVIKDGRRVRKTVTLSAYGNPKTGAVRKRELRFRTFEKAPDAPEVDFVASGAKNTWWCENEEIDRLLGFLTAEFKEPGRYSVIDRQSPLAMFTDALNGNQMELSAVAKVLAEAGHAARIIEFLTTSAAGVSAAELAVIAKRRKTVEELARLAGDPNVTETDVQRLIEGEYWLFGGQYVGVAKRSILPLDQYDIPLLDANGTLHLVELKGPVVPRLVRRHRNHVIVGNEVHEAVSQAMNYLRSLDELGAGITSYYRNELSFDFDLRRVFATVVIGHPTHVSEIDRRTIRQTFRSYNAHLSRVNVLTYDDLIEVADRSLAFQERDKRY